MDTTTNAPTISDDERQRAHDVYRAAIVVAKAEHDALLPQVNALQIRFYKLKAFILAGSHLIGEPLDTETDPYGFGPMRSNRPLFETRPEGRFPNHQKKTNG